MSSRPETTAQRKDATVRNKFKATAKHMSELQQTSTFKDGDRDSTKSQHFMFTYDELVQKPRSGETRRKQPQCIFLIPDHCDLEKLGVMLMRVSGQLFRGRMDFPKSRVRCTQSHQEYFEHVFGEAEKPTQSRKKKSKSNGK
jgi:hypothetical protein